MGSSTISCFFFPTATWELGTFRHPSRAFSTLSCSWVSMVPYKGLTSWGWAAPLWMTSMLAGGWATYPSEKSWMELKSVGMDGHSQLFLESHSEHVPVSTNQLIRLSPMFHMIFSINSHGNDNIMTYPHPMTNPSNLVQSNLWPRHQAESRRIPTSSDHMSPWLSILNCLKYNGGSSKP